MFQNLALLLFLYIFILFYSVWTPRDKLWTLLPPEVTGKWGEEEEEEETAEDAGWRQPPFQGHPVWKKVENTALKSKSSILPRQYPDRPTWKTGPSGAEPEVEKKRCLPEYYSRARRFFGGKACSRPLDPTHRICHLAGCRCLPRVGLTSELRLCVCLWKGLVRVATSFIQTHHPIIIHISSIQ